MNPARRLMLITQTASLIGWRDVAAVALHRVRERLSPPVASGVPLSDGALFIDAALPTPDVADPSATLDRARRIANGDIQIFGDAWIALGAPFDWTKTVLPDSPADIKGIWEASRFIWAPDLARAHRIDPEGGYLGVLDRWVEDWLARNPDFGCPTWQCGQEAAMRMINLLLAHRIVAGDAAISPRLADVVARHARRIEPTMAYAIAQQNNHATSEAAGLFVAGAVLQRDASTRYAVEAARWLELGRRSLETSVARLILSDGGFSQYSVNYHRVLIDTMAQVAFWRQVTGVAPLSIAFHASVGRAIDWLAALVDPHSGAVPNIGHNDGAQLYRLDEARYADFRPTLGLARAMFGGCNDGSGDEALHWLGLEATAASTCADAATTLFTAWGLARLQAEGSHAFVRFPVRRFRPGQADMLHLDLWTASGRNLLIDSGTYSYADPQAIRDFAGIAAHNSVRFDDGEPMRRLGRFLFADWPDADEVTEPVSADGAVSFSASYRDYRGIRHRRAVEGRDGHWMVTDSVNGYRDSAELRWHLPDQPVEQTADGIVTADMRISITADAPLTFSVATCFTSPTYGRKVPALVLIARMGSGGSSLRTEIALT